MTPQQARNAFLVVLFNALFVIVGVCVLKQLHPHGLLKAGVWADLIAAAGSSAFQAGRVVHAAGHRADE